MANGETLDLSLRSDVALREELQGDELLPAIDGEQLVAVPLAALVAAATPEPLPPPTWGDVSHKPTSFPPVVHQHDTDEVVGLDDALAAKADTATVAALAAELSSLDSDVVSLTEDMSTLILELDAKAPLASPELSGIPTAPTAVAGTNTLQIATTAFVTTAVAAIAPESVTWSDIADKPSSFTPGEHTHAIADVTGLSTALGDKAPLASPALTGTPTAPTASAGTNTTQISTTAFVQAALVANPRAIITALTSSGTYTVPAGVYAIDVQVWGGGGGGGGNGTSGQAAGGGGAGGYARARLTVTPGQTISYTIGAAGNAGSAGSGGGNGGTTSFGTTSATGGSGGSSNPHGAGGTGGTGSGGAFNLTGQSGGYGDLATDGAPKGGQGGSAPMGGGTSIGTYYTGRAGQFPGGGGSGSGSADVYPGGAGSAGFILVMA